MKRILLALAGAAIATSAANAQAGPASEPVLPANLAATRAALAKYQDPMAAVRDGYLSTVGCMDYPKGGGGMGEMAYKPGGMGVHFVNMGFVGPTLDSLKPQVLIYEPAGDHLRLVAAEWFMPTAFTRDWPGNCCPPDGGGWTSGSCSRHTTVCCHQGRAASWMRRSNRPDRDRRPIPMRRVSAACSS
jgi:hypothetical protein